MIYANKEHTIVQDGNSSFLATILDPEQLALVEPYVEPPAPIPTVVSSRQARLALLQSNLLDTVEATIKAGSRADQITWEFATEVRRDDDLVKNMAVALGLSDAQLDGLFTLASTL